MQHSVAAGVVALGLACGLSSAAAEDARTAQAGTAHVSQPLHATAAAEYRRAQPRRRAEPIKMEDAVREVQGGSSSGSAKTAANAELPREHLSPANRQRVDAIIADTTMFRALPVYDVAADPQVHRYFIDHPDVAVSIWRTMKISKFHLHQTGPRTFAAGDDDGTTGVGEVLWSDGNQLLAVCNGTIKSPLIATKFNARTVLHLKIEYVRDSDGQLWVRNHLKMFIAFDALAIEAAAKLFSPLANMILDRNLRDVCVFAHAMQRSMEHYPGWVEQLTNQLKDVPAARKQEFLNLTARMYVAARQRERLARRTEGVSLDELLKPVKTSFEETRNTAPTSR